MGHEFFRSWHRSRFERKQRETREDDSFCHICSNPRTRARSTHITGARCAALFALRCEHNRTWASLTLTNVSHAPAARKARTRGSRSSEFLELGSKIALPGADGNRRGKDVHQDRGVLRPCVRV